MLRHEDFLSTEPEGFYCATHLCQWFFPQGLCV
ncbi:hypothetical protein AFE_3232 [Acidithiobacillus ferrooxidans ATCC 23270]|uniref:Uncharacterized protein n=1 Tax=Acidithiobacillus ferrooxidans (strain ATCC 23270 / DSM 14882 / CIP 104768 / NCIMB 8455) TaxID=243159 RepID=B7JBB1_ACIF2|nr:hypothetical protein AFE_3232 [Acidithiobacillus ferrooxidans ATCC 23270]